MHWGALDSGREAGPDHGGTYTAVRAVRRSGQDARQHIQGALSAQKASSGEATRANLPPALEEDPPTTLTGPFSTSTRNPSSRTHQHSGLSFAALSNKSRNYTNLTGAAGRGARQRHGSALDEDRPELWTVSMARRGIIGVWIGV